MDNVQNGQVQIDRLTFFKSYWTSIKKLSPEKQLMMYDAIFYYAFENKEIEITTDLQWGFDLIKPNIDKSLKKKVQNQGSNLLYRNMDKGIGKGNGNRNKEMDIFVQFWSKYPRKEKKATCEEWFNKHDFTDEEFQNILSSLEKFKKTKQWQKKEFIPLATTWLNQRRWEDELSCEDLIEDGKDQIAKLEAEVERRKASGEWK